MSNPFCYLTQYYLKSLFITATGTHTKVMHIFFHFTLAVDGSFLASNYYRCMLGYREKKYRLHVNVICVKIFFLKTVLVILGNDLS